MQGPTGNQRGIQWVSLLLSCVVAAAFLGYLAARDLAGERVTLVGTVARAWVAQGDGSDGLWLELLADLSSVVAYTPRSSFGGSEAEWLALQGHRVRMTVHDVSLAPPVTPPLWRIDSIAVVG